MKLRTVAIDLVVLAALGSPHETPSFEKGLEATKRGDYAAALSQWRPLAEKGNANAQYNLGLFYDKGWGIARNYAEAALWYRKAADQGDADAQYNLATMYDDGQGVSQDYAEALRWYRRAAGQGKAAAQTNLANMYAAGRGVPEDFVEALHWYGKAAHQADAVAVYNLGVAYALGQGVPKDCVQAHKWYNLAAVRFQDSDKERSARAVENRDAVSAQMSATQIAEAEKLAREWLKAFEKRGGK